MIKAILFVLNDWYFINLECPVCRKNWIVYEMDYREHYSGYMACPFCTSSNLLDETNLD